MDTTVEQVAFAPDAQGFGVASVSSFRAFVNKYSTDGAAEVPDFTAFCEFEHDNASRSRLNSSWWNNLRRRR